MQPDVDIEPTFRFTYIKCTDKQRHHDETVNFTKNKRIYAGETIFFWECSKLIDLLGKKSNIYRPSYIVLAP